MKTRGVVVLALAALVGLPIAAAPAAAAPRPPRPTTYVPGYQVVSASSHEADSTNSKIAEVQCPTGKVPLGGGASIHPQYPDVFLVGLGPTNINGIPSFPGFHAHAAEAVGGNSANWSVTVYAICATRPPGYAWVEESIVTSHPFEAIQAECPAGSKIVGLGGYVDPLPLSPATQGQVRLIQMAPQSDLSGGHAVGARDASLSSGNWIVYSEIICASLPVTVFQADTDHSSSGTTQVGTASCQAGGKLLSGGFALNSWSFPAIGHLVVNWSLPSEKNPYNPGAPPYHGVIASEDKAGTSDAWWIQTYALCVAA